MKSEFFTDVGHIDWNNDADVSVGLNASIFSVEQSTRNFSQITAAMSKTAASLPRPIFNYKYIIFRQTWWRSWLRHCTSSRMVTGSIPDVVIGFLH